MYVTMASNNIIILLLLLVPYQKLSNYIFVQRILIFDFVSILGMGRGWESSLVESYCPMTYK